jgi:hypothetical protein
MEKLQKILLTLIAIGFTLPFIFYTSYTVNYETLGERTYYYPNYPLLIVPIVFLCLFVITLIWDKPNSKINGKD